MRWFIVPWICFFALFVQADEGIPLPEGYREKPYKAPTPDHVPGAATLFFSDDVLALIEQEGTLLINVSPITLSPPDKDGKRIWITRRNYKHVQIPGSHWLPNVGLHTLSRDLSRYFQTNLKRLSQDNRQHPVMFYCTADCWMSWNAAKRAALEYGYSNVYWYPIGIDGWKADGRPVSSAEPVPFTPRLMAE